MESCKGSLGTLWSLARSIGSLARSIGSLERSIGSLERSSQDPAILRMETLGSRGSL